MTLFNIWDFGSSKFKSIILQNAVFMPLEWKMASCRIQPSQPPRCMWPLNTDLGWHVSIMFQTTSFGAPGRRVWMKLASGYKLISERKGCWQILPHKGGLPPLNGWRHTQFCSVQKAWNGRNTRKMVSWRYVILFFQEESHTQLDTIFNSVTARGYLFVRFIDGSFIVLHNYYLE